MIMTGPVTRKHEPHWGMDAWAKDMVALIHAPSGHARSSSANRIGRGQDR